MRIYGECNVPSTKAVALGFYVCSLGKNTLMFIGTPTLVRCRVLINNLRNVVEAQFDSRVRATGHSYEKYNKWETV